MTKHLVLAAISATLAIFAAGCRHSRIATPPLSQEEAAWQAIIRESYPNYNPPPKTSRSFKGHTEDRVSANVRAPRSQADEPAGQPGDEEVKPEVMTLPAEKTETPAAEAEKPAEAAPAAEAGTPAAEADKPAETPAAEAEKPVETAPAANENKVIPPDPTNSTVYEVRSGDTLGSIAQKSYGNARFSDVIFKANSDILKSPHTLKPGMKLIIPKL